MLGGFASRKAWRPCRSARLPPQPELPHIVDGDEPEGQGEEVLKGLRLNDHPGVEELRARLKRFQKELHSPERQP